MLVAPSPKLQLNLTMPLSSRDALASNVQLFFWDGHDVVNDAAGAELVGTGFEGLAGGSITTPSEDPLTRSSRLGVPLGTPASAFVVALVLMDCQT